MMGLIPVHLLNKKLGIISDISNAVKIFDIINKEKIKQKVTEMLRQRIYGIISWNEDLNDHDDLRRDEVFKILVGRGNDLAGSSTLCRFENRACRDGFVEISKVFVENL